MRASSAASSKAALGGGGSTAGGTAGASAAAGGGGTAADKELLLKQIDSLKEVCALARMLALHASHAFFTHGGRVAAAAVHQEAWQPCSHCRPCLHRAMMRAHAPLPPAQARTEAEHMRQEVRRLEGELERRQLQLEELRGSYDDVLERLKGQSASLVAALDTGAMAGGADDVLSQVRQQRSMQHLHPACTQLSGSRARPAMREPACSAHALVCSHALHHAALLLRAQLRSVAEAAVGELQGRLRDREARIAELAAQLQEHQAAYLAQHAKDRAENEALTAKLYESGAASIAGLQATLARSAALAATGDGQELVSGVACRRCCVSLMRAPAPACAWLPAQQPTRAAHATQGHACINAFASRAFSAAPCAQPTQVPYEQLRLLLERTAELEAARGRLEQAAAGSDVMRRTYEAQVWQVAMRVSDACACIGLLMRCSACIHALGTTPLLSPPIAAAAHNPVKHAGAAPGGRACTPQRGAGGGAQGGCGDQPGRAGQALWRAAHQGRPAAAAARRDQGT